MKKPKSILSQLSILNPDEIKFIIDYLRNAKVGYKEAKESYEKSNSILESLQVNNGIGLMLQFARNKSVEEQIIENEEGIKLCEEALFNCNSILKKMKEFDGII